MGGFSVWTGSEERPVSAWLWEGMHEHLLSVMPTTPSSPQEGLPSDLTVSQAGTSVVYGGDEYIWLGAEWFRVAAPSWQSDFSSSMHPEHMDVKSYVARPGYAAFGHTPDHGVITPDNLLFENGRAIFRASWRETPLITGSGSDQRIRWHDEAYADHRRTSSSGSPIYEQRWGIWQITCQTPNGDNTQGSLAAFWGRHRNPGDLPAGHGASGEWDFMEAWGRGGVTPTSAVQIPGAAVFTIHSSTMVAAEQGIPYRKTLFRYQEQFGLYSPNTWSHLSRNDPTPGNRSWDGMHTYRVEYFPNYLAFSFDGRRKVVRPTDIDPHTPTGHPLGNTYAWLWNPAFFSGPIAMRANHHIGLGTPQLGGNPDPVDRSLTQDNMDYVVEDIKMWGYSSS